MELEELHILLWDASPQGDRRPIAGIGIGVRGDLPDAPPPAGREYDRFRVEGVDLAGCQLDRHHPGGNPIGQEQVQHLVLVEEGDVVLNALLVKGLQDHVPGPVGGVARSHHRLPGRVIRVTAERPLRDPPLGRPRERQPQVLEVVDGLDGFVAHELNGILVSQIIAALDRIVGMPLRVVFFQVAKRGPDPALSCAGMRAGGIQLAQDRGFRTPGGIQGCHQPRPAATDDDHLILVYVCHAMPPLSDLPDPADDCHSPDQADDQPDR